MYANLIRTLLNSGFGVVDLARSLCQEGETFDTAIPVDASRGLREDYNLDTSALVMLYNEEHRFGRIVNIWQFIVNRLAAMKTEDQFRHLAELVEEFIPYREYQGGAD